MEHLRIDTLSLAVAAPALTAHLQNLPLLTSLQLGDEYSGSDPAMPPALADALPPGLRRLELGAHADPSAAFAHQLLLRLRSPPQLTSLLLRCATPAKAAPPLRGAVYGEGLRTVTSLQSLSLEGCLLTEAEDLWLGLAALPKLQCLCLTCLQIHVRLPDVLPICVARAAVLTCSVSRQHSYPRQA